MCSFGKEGGGRKGDMRKNRWRNEIPESFLLDSGSKAKKSYTFFFFPHKCRALTMCQAMYSVFGIYSAFRFIAIVTLWGSCSFDSMD